MQSELNKKLYEAIHKEINWLYKSEDVTQPAATACEIICKEHAIEFAEFILKNNMSSNGSHGWGGGEINTNYYGSSSENLYKLFTEQPNSLKKV